MVKESTAAAQDIGVCCPLKGKARPTLFKFHEILLIHPGKHRETPVNKTVHSVHMLKYEMRRGKRKKAYFFFFIVSALAGRLALCKQHSTQGSPQIQGLV